MTMQVVSHSEAEAYVICERRHFYSYGLRLQKKGDGLPDALYRGKLGHIGLQAYFLALKNGSADPLQAGLKAVIDNVNQGGRVDLGIMAAVCRMIEGHHHKWKNSEWEVKEVETSRMYDINDELSTQIRPDLVVRIPGHGLAVVDNKFQYNFMSQTSLELAPQLPKYLKGLREHGVEVRSMWYNEIRYREINNPSPDQIYRRTQLPSTVFRVAQTFKEHTRIAKDIAAYKAGTLEAWEDDVVRTANAMVCKFCSFQELCRNDNMGESPRELMIEELYEPRPQILDAEIETMVDA